MPRLVGRQSNNGASVVLVLLIALGAATVLEYEGAINVVPNFGKDFVGDKTPVGLPDFSFNNRSGNNRSGAANAPADQPASSQPSPSSSLAQ